jgi:hypothetical protein
LKKDQERCEPLKDQNLRGKSFQIFKNESSYLADILTPKKHIYVAPFFIKNYCRNIGRLSAFRTCRTCRYAWQAMWILLLR